MGQSNVAINMNTTPKTPKKERILTVLKSGVPNELKVLLKSFNWKPYY